jgi:hypothetical protein
MLGPRTITTVSLPFAWVANNDAKMNRSPKFEADERRLHERKVQFEED